MKSFSFCVSESFQYPPYVTVSLTLFGLEAFNYGLPSSASRVPGLQVCVTVIVAVHSGWG